THFYKSISKLQWPMQKVIRKSRKDIMPKTQCRLLLSRLSLCCRAISTKAGMARRLAFLGIVCRQDSRYGIQLTFCCGLTGIGRYRGPRKVIRLCGERTNNGMNELFALARKRMIWSL